MDYKMTRHQVARTARPDAESWDKIHIFKACSELRATYQIKLLLFRAMQERRKLVLNVQKDCVFLEDLKSLIASNRKHVQVVRRP